MKKFPLIFRNQTKYPVVIKGATKHPIVLRGEERFSMVVDGLKSDTNMVGRNIAMQMLTKTADLFRTMNLTQSGDAIVIDMATASPHMSFHVDSTTGSVMQMTVDMSMSQELDVEGKTGVNMMLSIDDASMAITLPCYIDDWSDYYMADLEDMLLVDMTYTEVV